MFKFDRSDFQRTAGAAIGALLLSVTFVSAAVGPARAVETTPVAAAAQADVGTPQARAGSSL